MMYNINVANPNELAAMADALTLIGMEDAARDVMEYARELESRMTLGTETS